MSTKEFFFEGYVQGQARYDEVFLADGAIRPHWQPIVESLNQELAHEELRRRWTLSQDDLHEMGFAEPAGAHGASWARTVDFLPHLLGNQEWTDLTAGLRQRAQLLNLLLRDLYGPQRSLRDGLLPAEWLFAHAGFHRAYHNTQLTGGMHLYFYAADLVRGEDGRWYVVADRTDAPVGLGFALENRIAVSRLLPSLMEQHNVERFAPFFQSVDQALRQSVPGQAQPRVVLLSQGPSDANYVEKTYLARYLGYTLVEGGDLTVREDGVFLKTLAGLLPVDVIFRCQTDELCDPLVVQGLPESDQVFGIPGLLTAVQAGTVAVANALGSSLVESPSLLPFLPNLARGLLHQELRLPSVTTWWCGQTAAQSEVIGRRAAGGNPSWCSAYRSRLSQHASAQPPPQDLSGDQPRFDLVAQEPLSTSVSPLGFDPQSGARSVHMRVFVAASSSGYQVLPGGLIRLVDLQGAAPEDSFAGGVSRDAWVIAQHPVKHVSLLSKTKHPPVLRRSAADIPSRVADNLFWFGRFVERSQGNCRLLRPLINRMIGEGESRDSASTRYLVRCLAAGGQIEPTWVAEEMQGKLSEFASMLPSMVVDPAQPGSLIATIAKATANASRVRDRLSLDCWKLIYQADRIVQGAHQVRQFGLVELEDLVDRLLTYLVAIDGLVSEGMTRSYIWRFLELGRRMERILALCSMLKVLAEDAPDESDRAPENKMLESVLECADSVMTYRSRYASEISRAATLDLLITDESNPRGLAFQLAEIAEHVAQLPQGEVEVLGSAESKIPNLLLHGVRMLELEDLQLSSSDSGDELGTLLSDIAEQLPKLSSWISHRYLIHAGVPRQFSGQNRNSES